MRRREFLAVLGVLAGMLPLAAQAQPAAIPAIGFLNVGSADSSADRVAAFRQGLKETGYVEGRNVTVEYYWSQGQYDRVPAVTVDLVARQVSVIVAISLPIALAAKTASKTIPIVFLMGDDPVKFGLVASLNRPGGNLTGITFLSPEIEAKRVELLHELAPQASTIAALVNPNFPSAEVRATAVRSAASTLGLQLTVYNARSESEIATAFEEIAERRTGALIVTTDPVFSSQREQLTRLAARYRLPAIYDSSEFTASGGLMSYGSDVVDSYRRVGVYAARILKGDKPADLPVQQPTKFELIINLKTAKPLGLTVPPALLTSADEVIE
jgi:putative tryptophan/tyrosine transport system substrate-binding protein